LLPVSGIPTTAVKTAARETEHVLSAGPRQGVRLLLFRRHSLKERINVSEGQVAIPRFPQFKWIYAPRNRMTYDNRILHGPNRVLRLSALAAAAHRFRFSRSCSAPWPAHRFRQEIRARPTYGGVFMQPAKRIAAVPQKEKPQKDDAISTRILIFDFPGFPDIA
jgi:hypothetical protein